MDTVTIGEYSGLHLVGQGAMGEVFAGDDPKTGKKIAIKRLIKPGGRIGTGRISRFMQEAKLLKDFEHPHIVKVFDVDIDEMGVPFLVMEYIEGTLLADRLDQRGAIPFEEAIRLIEQLASALDYVHNRGIVHRDVKPQNIMVRGLGLFAEAILMDFGLAKGTDPDNNSQSGLLGTLHTMAPEQLQKSGPPSPASDIYSLAVVAYHMLTGQPPFEGSNPSKLVIAHMTAPPPNPRAVVLDLPPAAALAVQKGMAKSPNERFPTAGAMARAMRM